VLVSHDPFIKALETSFGIPANSAWALHVDVEEIVEIEINTKRFCVLTTAGHQSGFGAWVNTLADLLGISELARYWAMHVSPGEAVEIETVCLLDMQKVDRAKLFEFLKSEKVELAERK